MRLFPFTFWRRRQAQSIVVPVQQVKILPLPCPIHKTVLIPEQGEKPGEFHFYCPVCRLRSQPVQEPIRQVRFPRPGRQLSGSLMHTERAIKRVERKLGYQLPPARPQFHTIQTVAEMPVIHFPDAG